MKFKNKTKYNFEVLYIFNTYHLNHSVFVVFSVVVAFLLAVYMFFSYIETKQLSNLLFALIFILFTGFAKVVNSRVISSKLQKLKINEKENIYEFYEDYLKFENNEIKYNEFKKIKMNKGFIYFYINSVSAYIVDTKDMKDSCEFIKFLKEAVKR